MTLGIMLICSACGQKEENWLNADSQWQIEAPEADFSSTEQLANTENIEENAENISSSSDGANELKVDSDGYKTADFINWQQQGDLAVNFDFPVEIVDVAFISPSGQILEKNSFDYKGQNGSLEWAEGDNESGMTWATYRIHNAEKGQWQIKYNLGKNDSINYSIIDDREEAYIDPATEKPADTVDIVVKSIYTPVTKWSDTDNVVTVDLDNEHKMTTCICERQYFLENLDGQELHAVKGRPFVLEAEDGTMYGYGLDTSKYSNSSLGEWQSDGTYTTIATTSGALYK
ncbi:hypothetical protein [Butyrivibrio proteoclasticus]|nr:hypothetical protein [Butyrivibrio proteoclasticus]